MTSPSPPPGWSGSTDALVERIQREGPIPFDAFVEAALYGDRGFFTDGHGAGRSGRDFVTSPEVGRLFGTLVARAVDRAWGDLGEPDPFFVLEAGAGRGRLAADVLAAGLDATPALRYLLVERSPALRALQSELLTLEPIEDAVGPTTTVGDEDDAVPVAGAGPIVSSLGELPEVALTGMVLANELLDNLPFRIVERADDGWAEVRVALSDGTFEELLVPASAALAAEADVVAALDAGPEVPLGARLPVPTGLASWLSECARTLHRGVLIVIDYAATTTELVERGQDGWLRTYRDHQRGTSPLDVPGSQDITADVPIEYLVAVARRAGFVLVDHATQAEWLRSLGVDQLAAEARAAWDERAHIGDLEALTHRSRVTEAAALIDPSGLGAHRVLTFTRGK
jgi:NADH dehydrogenase [ubiquinone] 1 alpha subcomplex assembly factor 7